MGAPVPHGLNLCTWNPLSPGIDQPAFPKQPIVPVEIPSPSPPPSANQATDSLFQMYYNNWLAAPPSEKLQARKVLDLFLEINPEYNGPSLTPEEAASIKYYTLLMQIGIATLKQKVGESTESPQIGWAELEEFGTMHPEYQPDIARAKLDLEGELGKINVDGSNDSGENR